MTNLQYVTALSIERTERSFPNRTEQMIRAVVAFSFGSKCCWPVMFRSLSARMMSVLAVPAYLSIRLSVWQCYRSIGTSETREGKCSSTKYKTFPVNTTVVMKPSRGRKKYEAVCFVLRCHRTHSSVHNCIYLGMGRLVTRNTTIKGFRCWRCEMP